MQIEHDPRFNRLLDKVEREIALSAEDQKWFDSMLDEAEDIMKTLGLSLDEDEEDMENQEDVLIDEDEARLKKFDSD